MSLSWRTAFHTAACLGAAAMFAVLATRTQTWANAEWFAARHRDEVERWAAGVKPWHVTEWAEAEADLKQAANVLPNDPSLHELLGTLYSLRGAQAWFDLSRRQAWFMRAEAEQLRVVELRPTVPQGWANIAMTRYLAGQPMVNITKPWRESVKLGPFERNTKRLLLNVSLGRWDEAPTDMKKWTRDLRNHPEKSINLDSWVAYYRITEFEK